MIKKTLPLILTLLTLSPAVRLSSETFLAFDPESAISQFQEEHAAQHPKPHVLHVQTKLVVVDAAVKDKDGHLMLDLKKEDFRVFENGVEQKIENFSRDGTPIALALVADASGSLHETAAKLRNAARVALQALKPQDQTAFWVFAETPVEVVQLTQDKNQISSEINAINPRGGTNINDALQDAMRDLNENAAPNSRKVIILVSDDAARIPGELGHKDLVKFALDSDIAIYNILVPGDKLDTDALRASAARNELVYTPDLVTATGGGEPYNILNTDKSTLEQTLASVIDGLRKRYILEYYPLRDDPKTEWRRIVVELKGKTKGKDYTIFHKKGYHSTQSEN